TTPSPPPPPAVATERGLRSREEQARKNILAAKKNGYERGASQRCHEEGANHDYSPKVVQAQDGVLKNFVDWSWVARGCTDDIESLEVSILGPGAEIPTIEELRDFWDFYHKRSKGRIRGSKNPYATMKSLRMSAKRFNGGFSRRTGIQMPAELVSLVNKHIKRITQGTRNPQGTVSAAERPKYNFGVADLDRVLLTLWTRRDLRFIHERERAQFHFILESFCWSGGRSGAFFEGGGLKYKDTTLVLRRTNKEGEWALMWKLDQRYVKNALHPNDIAHSMTGRQRNKLRYNDGFLLVMMAIADGALFGISSPDDLWQQRIPDGDNETHLLWNDSASTLPIARRIENGKVSREPMTEKRFRTIFDAVIRGSDYVGITPSVHQIRRETAGKLNKRYTAAERSQHILHFHPGIFDEFYAGNISSCDGAAAFLDEDPDHSVPEFFRGIGQFRERGVPTELPTALDAALKRNPEVLALEQAMSVATGVERVAILTEKKNLLKKLRREKLESYRWDWLVQRRKEKVLSRGRLAQCPERDPHPLNELIPQKGRLAILMADDSAIAFADLQAAMEDVLFLLKEDWTVLYRPGERPRDGCCPECNKSLERLKEQRRWRHIHDCKRRAEAKSRAARSRDLIYCFFCSEWFPNGSEWDEHCRVELQRPPLRQYGVATYRHTIILPAFCLFCRQSEKFTPSQRMQYWERDADAIRHMLEAHGLPAECHQCNVQSVSFDHLHDAHGYSTPRTQAGKLSESIAPLNTCTSEQWAGGESGGSKVPMVRGLEHLELPSLASTWPPSDDSGVAAVILSDPAYLDPQLLQWPIRGGEGPAATSTPFPSSPDGGRTEHKLGNPPLSPSTLALTPPPPPDDLLWSDHATLEGNQAYSASLQAADLGGTKCMDITRTLVSEKRPTRIRIVGEWAEWLKTCGYKKHESPKPETDLRSYSPATSLTSDAFMEDFFCFPSPSDDATSTLSVDNGSTEERILDKDSRNLDLFSENDSLFECLSVQHDVYPHASAVPAGTTRFSGADERCQDDQDRGVDASPKGRMHGGGTPHLRRSGSVLVSLVSPTSESAAAAASAPATRQPRKRRKANSVSGLEDVRPLKRMKKIGLRGTMVPEAKTNNDRTQGTSSGDRDSKSPEFEASCIIVALH
ncbi:hypothetical protein F5144DRAFT_586453, partial [Chaetomium tenue]